MEKFVHLHNHTEYSLLDGAARIKKLIEVTKERGWPAVAITDHGNMYGALQFYSGCLANGIKPIIGTEFYICDDLTNKVGKHKAYHQILLAKNNQGYKNLLLLNSISFKDGFYYKPRIDFKTLEAHHDGLICLSACLAGPIPQAILLGQMEEAERLAKWYKNLFGEDFYLEVQNHGLEEQQIVNRELKKLSQKLGIKLVATNDCHYIAKEDAEMQDVPMCVQMGKKIDDPDRMKFSTDEFYYKDYDEMKKAMAGMEESLVTTLEIADKCDVLIRSKGHGDIAGIDPKYVMPATENYIPKYVPENGMTPYEFLRHLTFEGLNKKYKEVTPEILARAEMELEVIHSQGFVEYFLIVWDYINYARQSGIPVGPGRGSGAGSLVAYASGITLVDPLKYALVFERFINKERVSMPDFDVDFDYDRREEVIEYVKRKYGDDHVALIATFGTMAAKNAIRDVARTLNMPYSEADKIAKLIPAKLPAGIKKPPVLKYYFGTTGKEENDKYIIPELRALYDSDPSIKRVCDLAIKLEGTPRNVSTHACGTLIAPESVDTYVPLTRSGEDISTQYNMVELEQLGLLKMDFLGLKTLTDINKALKYVKEDKGIDIDFYAMDYDDKNVYDLISSGKTEAIFQLESEGMKKFMRDLKPDCLEDIIAGVSLYRPGPMDSIPRYIKNKQNPNEIVYAHPCLEPILNVTYGCIVYQEQVMKIFQVMGGYNMGQADNVRRIMGKKKVEKMPAEKKKFIEGWDDPTGRATIPGALKLGVSREVAEQIFGEMESFAQYAFNKSHAAAYAYLSYQTAYLKCYHEIEFLCAVLNNRITNSDEIKKYVIYVKEEGFKVLPPDINKSQTYFSVEDGNLRFGLAAIKNVGISVIDSIIEERNKNGEFKDFMDFVKRVDQQARNKRCLESLILAGAFDSLGLYRSQLMNVYENAVSRIASEYKSQLSGQFSLFDSFGTQEQHLEDKLEIPNIKEFSKDAMLKYEKEVVGIYLSGHPLDDYIDKFKNYNLNSSMLEVEESETDTDDSEEKEETSYSGNVENDMKVVCGGIITEIRKTVTKNGNREMGFAKLEDLYGTIELTFFPNAYRNLKNMLIEDTMATIKGKLNLREGEKPTIIVDEIIPWKETQKQEIQEEKKEKLYLKFDVENVVSYNTIVKILSTYPGQSEVIVKSSSSGNAFKMNKHVSINQYLLGELLGVLSESDVVVR
ncbi:MAG: DNA polymerase III subunit alpha [Firmicutes bacterium]|nr:DNA polymerase III subunit alpha [Bacillota bacterium]